MSCRNVFSDRKLDDLFLVWSGYVSGCCWLKHVHCLSGWVVLRHRWTIGRDRSVCCGQILGRVVLYLHQLCGWVLLVFVGVEL